MPDLNRPTVTGMLPAPTPSPPGIATLTTTTAGTPAVTPSTPTTPPLPLLAQRWKAQTGLTHARSTLRMTRGGFLVVGSGGQRADGPAESRDGVAVLQAATGQHVRLIRTSGDRGTNVNGIAVLGGDLFWGTDNGQLYRGDVAGRVHWIAWMGGPIAGAPALADLDRDQRLDAVAVSEVGEVIAFGGQVGSFLWRIELATGPDRQPGVRYLSSPALADLDGDEMADVVVATPDGRLVALSGKDGHQLWLERTRTGLQSSPWLQDVNGDRIADVLWAETGGRVGVNDGRTGRPLWSTTLKSRQGTALSIEASPVFVLQSGDGGCAVVGTATGDGQPDGLFCVGSRGVRWSLPTRARISSSAAVGDLLGQPRPQLIVGVEDGRVLVLDPEGRLLHTLSTGDAVEATPYLADLDQDQKLDLVVVTRNGTLLAFQGAGVGPAPVAGFRGGLDNTGRPAEPR